MSKDKNDQVFDVNRVRDFIELMKEHDLSEIDLRQADKRIKLRRGPEEMPRMAMPAMAPMANAGAVAGAGSAGGSAAADADDGNFEYIKSPTVGTFYSKPKPDAPTFVKVGDTVSPDTIICLVEAMKMFNEIPAGISGKVVACLVDNEEAVDVNKPLFKIAPL